MRADTSKTQIVVIRGGETWNTYEEYISFLNAFSFDLADYERKSWKRLLAQTLGDGYEVIMPEMPNAMNAKYSEWKIWFEKHIPFLRDGVLLIGSSLGGTFLAKYLSETIVPLKIRATFFAAAAYFDKNDTYSMADFILPDDLSGFASQAGEVYLYQSEDDPVVPLSDVYRFKDKLPNAHVTILHDRGHMRGEEFPELIADIKALQ